MESEKSRVIAPLIHVGEGSNKPNGSKFLFIGNSQMQCYDLPQMVKIMSESAPADRPRVTIGRALLA